MTLPISSDLTEKILHCAHQRQQSVETLLTQLINDCKPPDTTQQMLAAIAEYSEDAITSTNSDGIITTWNKGAEKLYGYSADEAIGQSIRLVIPPDNPDELPTIMEALQRGESVKHYETERLHKDGSRRTVSLSVSPLKDSTGTLIGTSAIVRDITAQKMMAEEQRQTFFSLLPVGISILDANRQIVQMNPTLQKILDISLDDLLAGRYRDLQFIRPDGTPMPPEEFPSIKAWHEQQAFFDVEIGVVKSNGTIIWTSVNAAPLPDHQGVVIVTTDITGQKAADAELRRHRDHLEELVIERTQALEYTNQLLQAEKQQSEIIFSYMADGVILADIEGKILYVNPTWERMTGYTLSDALGKSPSLFRGVALNPLILQKMWQTLNAGEVWVEELSNIRRDGTPYIVQITAAPVINGQGEVSHFVSVARDITEAHGIAKMKEEFIANAAHDLNNPITVLKTSLYLLKNDPTQLDQRLEILDEQVNSLQSLVDDLLTISRLDRGVFVPNFQMIDCNQLVSRVIASQQSVAQQKQITLSFEPNPDLPSFMADRKLLERVIVNLIINALNYTHPNGQVNVQTTFEDNEVVISIADTGIGIAEADLPYIYDRFFRANAARETASGTGLGLSIVKEVVDLHHGRVEVQSQVGIGTVFYVYLP